MSVSYGERMFGRLEALDRALIAKGWPPLSPWWRETFRRFYTSGRKQLVARVGRRGEKSSSLCRFAVVEMLFGDHRVPPGDVGFIAFVSLSRKEARSRLRTISQILDALGVTYAASDESIEITDRRKEFTPRTGCMVLTCTIGGVSGWTCIGTVADEVSKWRSSDTAVNPADEVLASLKPTMATQRNARIVLSSSPMTESDAHARAFAKGDTEYQTTAFAATWTANPTVSEGNTRADEPDERVWAREYAAIPAPEVLDGFLADVIDGCVDGDRPGTTSGLGGAVAKQSIVIATDPASRHDEWALAIVRPESRDDGAPRVVVEEVRGWRPKRGEPLSVEGTVREIARIARQLRVNHIVGDQHHADSLRALFQRHGITYQGIPWTAPSKLARFTTLRGLMSDRRLRLPSEPKTIGQLRSIGVHLLPSGVETIKARGSDDRAFALCLAVTEAIKYAPVGSENGTVRASVRVDRDNGILRTVDEHLRYDAGGRSDWSNGMFGF